MKTLIIILIAAAALFVAAVVFALIKTLIWRKRIAESFRQLQFNLAEKMVGLELTPMPEDGNTPYPKIICPYMDFVYNKDEKTKERIQNEQTEKTENQ